MNKVCLASDNWSKVHPHVLQSIIEANEGDAAPYGGDPWTENAQHLIQKALGAPCKVFFIPSGTGANVLALKIATKRYESIICTDIAHINFQESGAAESIVGCKLLTFPHLEGKLTPCMVLKKLKSERTFGKHATVPGVLSITQPTEMGTVYTLEELKALSKLCKEEQLIMHMDGSRIYNAAVSLNASLADIVNASKADILSLGGTKNGLMGTEALIIFNPDLKDGSDHLHKQTLQLMSKMRFLAAQYIPFFTNDLWKELASHSNKKAHAIASIIQSIPHLALSHPVETNQIFFTAPAEWIPLIQEKIACYSWDKENEIRFIASWNTSEEDVCKVEKILSEIQITFECKVPPLEENEHICNRLEV